MMKRSTTIRPIDVPRDAEIGRYLAGAYFSDAYETPIDRPERSALDLYLDMVGKTPRWVNVLMDWRNWVVAKLGLKNLGRLNGFREDAVRGAKVGDRVGIFTLLFVSEREVILGDFDKHLNARVSLRKFSDGGQSKIAVSTVVHVHNALGRVYLFFVVPVHKLIVPAMLKLAPQ